MRSLLRAAAASALLACAACAPAADVRSTPVDGGAPSGNEDGGAREPADGGATTDASEAAPCALARPRYYAFLTKGRCADVEGRDGTWTARSAFADAPAAVRDVACRYEWFAAASGAPADVAALDALEAEHLTEASHLSVACDSLALDVSTLTPVPLNPPGSVGAPTGVTGCDVCARVDDRRAYVILPANDLELRTLLVTTVSGIVHQYRVDPPTRTQVFSVALPSAPAGDAFADGPISLVRVEPR